MKKKHMKLMYAIVIVGAFSQVIAFQEPAEAAASAQETSEGTMRSSRSTFTDLDELNSISQQLAAINIVQPDPPSPTSPQTPYAANANPFIKALKTEREARFKKKIQLITAARLLVAHQKAKTCLECEPESACCKRAREEDVQDGGPEKEPPCTPSPKNRKTTAEY